VELDPLAKPEQIAVDLVVVKFEPVVKAPVDE
jgi:hypothetical protein